MCATAQQQSQSSRFPRWRISGYWIATILVAFENSAGAMWVFLPLIPHFNHTNAAMVFVEYLRTMLAHLGYPPYFKYILGPWQFACAAALLAPRLPRVKEWAYIGAFFNYSSALVSHLFAGDGADIPAAVFAALTIVSWSLRPPDRRLEESAPVETKTSSWLASAGLMILLLLLSLFYLPHSPKP
jgi:hypothetical protein